MSTIFVSATGTDVGKTWVCGALMAAWPEARYWKPCQTGPLSMHDGPAISRDWGVDASRIHDVGSRYDEPASPHYAAALEGERCSLAPLLELAAELPSDGTWIVEGAGGLLVPLNERELIVDIPVALRWPVLLVASTKLGGINETLLSLEAMKSRGLAILGVVSNGPTCDSYNSALAAYAPGLHLYHVPQVERPFSASAMGHASELVRILKEKI